MPRIDVVERKLEDIEADALVLQVLEGAEKPELAIKVPESILQEIDHVISSGKFKGKLGQLHEIFLRYGKVRCIMLLGLGKEQEIDLERIRHTHGYVAIRARDMEIERIAVPLLSVNGINRRDIVFSITEAFDLSLYRFDKYKSKKESKDFPKEVLIIADDGNVEVYRKATYEAKIISDAVKLARDISNTPSSEIPPRKLADLAIEVGRASGFSVRVYGMDELISMGMGGIVSVGKGSENEPVLIHMEYDGGGKTIALIGKAVIFDSGGISIKPSERMEEMKYDKSGGAAVIAIMKAAAELKLPVKLIGLVPTVENLPSGKAFKPGDIIRFRNGKTAEIINTDAEGRLIMADALAYASEFKPDVIIDLATLTGACVIALGTHASGLFSNDDKLAEMLIKAGEKVGERLWRLPLWKEYFDQIKSDVADIKNVGGRPAGAITAAAFLMNFVGEGIPWAHIDIAGTAWTQESSPEKSYIPKGATGVGVRLIVEFLRSQYT